MAAERARRGRARRRPASRVSSFDVGIARDTPSARAASTPRAARGVATSRSMSAGSGSNRSCRSQAANSLGGALQRPRRLEASGDSAEALLASVDGHGSTPTSPAARSRACSTPRSACRAARSCAGFLTGAEPIPIRLCRATVDFARGTGRIRSLVARHRADANPGHRRSRPRAPDDRRRPHPGSQAAGAVRARTLDPPARSAAPAGARAGCACAASAGPAARCAPS